MSNISNILMSRLGIGTSLPTGGTYDILLVQTPTYPVGRITFSYHTTKSDSSAAITGIQKCAQYFLKVLFTNKGSDLLHINYGTSLPSLLIGANANLSSPELISGVSSAVQDAVSQSIAFLNTNNNDKAASMGSVKISKISQTTVDNFNLTLQLTTLAGETGLIALPYPLLDYPLSNG
jgi:phage baseplate assembly protein W